MVSLEHREVVRGNEDGRRLTVHGHRDPFMVLADSATTSDRCALASARGMVVMIISMTRKVIMSSRARSRVPRSLTYHREDGSRAILFDAASFASKTEVSKRVEPIDRTLPARADQLPGLLFAVDLSDCCRRSVREGVWTLSLGSRGPLLPLGVQPQHVAGARLLRDERPSLSLTPGES